MQDTSSDDIAYVMDDGLTSISGVAVSVQTTGIRPETDGTSYIYFTFIGTGISTLRVDNGTGSDEHDEYIDGIKVRDGVETGDTTAKWITAGINLPYGTHIYSIQRTNVDAYNRDTSEVGFHQPKRPPIPEDAVVIADYMLMADYVQNTSATIGTISKGVRRIGGSRDHFYNCAGAIVAFAPSTSNVTQLTSPFYWYGPGSHASNTMAVTLPYFGTSFTSFAEDQSQTHTFTLDGSAVTPTEADSDETRADLFYHAVSTLGQHTKVHTLPAGGYRFAGTDVASPIHTSSHYQTFETPFLHELIGGDRNMEQTNLVVTPDGRSWDEVTRDTSYLGMFACLQVQITKQLGQRQSY